MLDVLLELLPVNLTVRIKGRSNGRKDSVEKHSKYSVSVYSG
jgi:hypothetical protein